MKNIRIESSYITTPDLHEILNNLEIVFVAAYNDVYCTTVTSISEDDFNLLRLTITDEMVLGKISENHYYCVYKQI